MRLIKAEHFETFKSRGVPPAVLLASHPEKIERHINIVDVPKETGSAVLDTKRQIAAVASFEKKVNSKKNEKPFLLFSSRSYDFIALQYSLKVVASVIEESGTNFYWHSVYGGYHDPLRDDPDFAKKALENCGLLVIGNIAINSVPVKIEKVRDLLTKYSDIPRIVATGGVDPVVFAKTILHVKPDYFISC